VSERNGRPEVLAPAGDRASLEAAALAGADAVYFGLQGFNARARATNFDDADLRERVSWLHARGVKAYVTLNTLVFDHELEAVSAAVRACADAGVDAVIVQDLGVARLVRALAPSLPIHASTQMTCTDAGAVALAAELGASRVILARELSLDDIAAIRAATDVELEVFVHGALCVAYSGQCLTSEAIGGRSANRGACAQACRLPYELVVDGEVRDLGDRAYLLSPQDLEASALIPQLAALGVASVKIEGRLKGPAYVAAVTRLYREAVDATPAPGRRERALQMFTRGSDTGFLRGVDHQRLVEGASCDHRGVHLGSLESCRVERGRELLRLTLAAPLSLGDGVLVQGGARGEGEVGGRVWSMRLGDKDIDHAEVGQRVSLWLGPDRTLGPLQPGRNVWRTDAPGEERAALAEVERAPHRRPVSITVRADAEGHPVYTARGPDGSSATVRGEEPLRPGNGSLAEVLREKLGRLGDTAYVLDALDADLPAGMMIPPSSMNRARRALVSALTAGTVTSHTVSDARPALLLAAAAPPSREPPPAGLFALCRNRAQAVAALESGADGVVLDLLELTGTGDLFRALRAQFPGRTLTLAPPRIRKPGEEKIDRYLRGLGPDAVMVRGLGALRDGDAGLARVGDASLNVTNRLTAAEVLSRGLIAFTPSFDLDAAQLVALLDGAFAPWAEVVVHHPMPLFHMEHCVFAALLSEGRDHLTCGRPCERHALALRDRAGMDHPVEADVGCRNTVFHAAAQSAAGVVPTLVAQGVRRFRVELVRESAEDVARILGQYRALIEGRAQGDEVFRALRAEGGYGVVRGSLRVLS
jgi:putative protease